MSVTFLSPLGALAGLLALVPLGSALIRERRLERVRRALRLPAPERRLQRSFVAAAAGLFGLLAVAAAQPVVRLDDPVSRRTDAEAFFLFDTSRSMLAAGSPGSPTRFDRARAAGLELRQALQDVPVGVASMTDRPLPHLFPTVDDQAFAAVLDRAIGVDRPPPAERSPALATDLSAVAALARENYFSPRSARRLVVLFTDGESRSFDAPDVAGKLERQGVGLVVVRFWDAGERVYGPGGRAEPGYVPDRSSDEDVDRLAALTTGRRVFAESEAGEALAAAREHLGAGPLVEAVEQERSLPLGGYLVLAAGVPLAVLLVRRPGPGRLGEARS